MGQILLGLFLAYLLYNFIFRFLIPLIRVTRQVKRQVRDFQQHVNTQPGGYQPGGSTGGFNAGASSSGHYQAGGFQPGDFPGSSRAQSSGHTSGHNGTSADPAGTTVKQEPRQRPAKDDYIDFEEIK